MVDGLVMRGGRVALALVLDVGDVAGVGVTYMVVDDLLPAVGKEDVVGAAGGLTVPVLAGTKVDTVVIINNLVSVIVDGGFAVLGFVVFGGGFVGGGGPVGIVGGDDSHDSEESNKDLKVSKIIIG